MFFTFLNKNEPQSLDISVISGYFPDVVLTYYYNSQLSITLSTYWEMKQTAAENTDAGAPIREWEMFFAEIDLDSDLDNFSSNEYIHIVGPYYYPLTNTCIYLTKDNPSPSETFTAEDLATLINLEHSPEIDKELFSYYKSRKGKKNQLTAKSNLAKISICAWPL